MIAMDNYFSSYRWYVQLHPLSQHAATSVFLINNLPDKDKIQSPGILKLLAIKNMAIGGATLAS